METFGEENYLNLLKSGNKKEAILIYSEKNNCSRIEAETQMTNLELKYSIVQNSNTLDEELRRMIQAGKKIQAIKLYKEKINCGLKDAKDYVDKLENPFSTGTKKEGCFIATVCYGSYFADEVVVLRRLRDNVLENYLPGRLFIKTYYLLSPTLAKLIDKSETAKAFLRKYILSKLILRLKNI